MRKVLAGQLTLEEIPERWREAVQTLLDRE